MAADTADRRAAQRARAAERREAQEADYQDELADAIVAYLDFAHEHTELARQIAEGAATTASQVGSGRVGRTRTLDLDERARLAATAYIRHHHTDYDDRLIQAQVQTATVEVDDDTYRRIRRNAATAVDDFIDRHRNPST